MKVFLFFMSFLGLPLVILYAHVTYEDGGTIEIENGETYYHQWPNNPGKVLLLEWLLEAINSEYVEFDSEGHKNAFINKINALIGTSYSGNWEGAYHKIETDLKNHANSWISTTSDKEIAIDLLDITSHMYADRTSWIETGANFKMILFNALQRNYMLTNAGSTIKIHFKDCAKQSIGEIFVHHADCDWKIIYRFPDPQPAPSPK